MSKSTVSWVQRRKSARASVDVSRWCSANCLSGYDLIPAYALCERIRMYVSVVRAPSTTTSIRPDLRRLPEFPFLVPTVRHSGSMTI
jgi:hypothetical protein